MSLLVATVALPSATFVLPSLSSTTTAECACEKIRTLTFGTCTSEKSATSKVALFGAGSTDHAELTLTELSSIARLVVSAPVRSVA